MTQPITVQEMFDFCIERENTFLAHLIYWALQNKLAGLQDDWSLLKEIPVDMETVKDYMEQNILGMRLVKLYVVRDAQDYYAFYFAHNSLEVMNLHTPRFGPSKSIVEAPSLMHRLMHIEAIKDSEFLIDYRKRFVEFPVYIGHARAHEHYIQRLDGQVSRVV